MILNKNEVLIDFLKIKDLKIIQRNDYFNFSLDTVLLANFVTINRTIKNILDIGTGNAAIPLLLSKRSTACITGVEIQEVSADLAKRNIILNKLDNRINILKGDIRRFSQELDEASFDLVLSNPPFFKLDKNKNQLKASKEFNLARHEVDITLEEIIASGAKLLRNRGYFAMVHRADRLADIINIFIKYNIAPKRIQICYSKSNKNGKIILIEGLKDASSNLTILPPLFCHKDDGSYSEDIMRMFKGKY